MNGNPNVQNAQCKNSLKSQKERKKKRKKERKKERDLLYLYSHYTVGKGRKEKRKKGKKTLRRRKKDVTFKVKRELLGLDPHCTEAGHSQRVDP